MNHKSNYYMPCVVQLSFIGARCRKRGKSGSVCLVYQNIPQKKGRVFGDYDRFGVLISQLSLLILNLVLPTNRRIRIFPMEYLSDIVSSD